MKKSVFLKMLLALMAICAAAVVISQVANKNESASKVDETEYEVSPPTIEQTTS